MNIDRIEDPPLTPSRPSIKQTFYQADLLSNFCYAKPELEGTALVAHGLLLYMDNMTAVLLFIVIVIGINCIPQLTKTQFPTVEKIICQILVIATLAFLISTVLLLCGYKLKGTYPNLIIGAAFILSSLLFFGLVQNTRKKIIIVLLVTPLVVLSLFTCLFGRVVAEYKLTDVHTIEVTAGSPLACGDSILISKNQFGIFDRILYYDRSLCLSGIKDIKTIKFNKETAQFLIYHDGEMDSENPYHHTIKNVW